MPSTFSRAQALARTRTAGRPSFWLLLALVTLAVLAAMLPSCSHDPTGPTGNPQVLESFEVFVPDWVRANTGFPLSVEAVGSHGTQPLPYATGTVNLSVSQGTLSPSSVVLKQGKATVNAVLGGALGSVTVTARQGAIEGSRLILTVSPDSISGNASDDVSSAVPSIAYFPRAADFSTGYPDLPGAYVSHNTLLIAFELGTTVGEANRILDDVGGAIVGGMPGIPGTVEGVVMARLATTFHGALQPILTDLEANTGVETVFPDVAVRTGRLPSPIADGPYDWDWEPTPIGGNWGLELIRVPQMWNVYDAVARRATRVAVGVVDHGFPAHIDLEYTTTGSAVADHGAMVSGIIGATFNNLIGIDGINPFADIWIGEINPVPLSGVVYHTAVDNIQTFRDLVLQHQGVEVVNWSIDYAWCQSGIDAATNAHAQATARRHGEELKRAFRYISAVNQRLPLIISIAGNGSGGTCGTQGAAFASPCNNAALDNGAPTPPVDPGILVIEALERNAASPGGAQRAPFSNTGGHLSAPGVCIRSTAAQRPDPPRDRNCDVAGKYKSDSGTSFAAPHVAGVISFMLAVDPTLTVDEILDIVYTRSVAVGGGANRIDAWASVVDIDRVRGSDSVLRMLVDIDDGTPDGNQRLDSAGEWVEFDTHGDGAIDISDFRRWRDWYLQIENDPTLRLDGGSHPKKDPNGNSVPNEAAKENVYPRGDFNGDGLMDLWATSFVPGAVDASVTDLEMLQRVFSDPDYDASDLPNLVHSGDVTISPAGCFDPSAPEILANGYVVASTATLVGNPTPTRQIRHTSPQATEVITLPLGQYQIALEVRDPSSGDVLASETRDVTVALGGDVFVQVGSDQECVRPAPIRDVVQIAFADYGFEASPGNHGLANLGDLDGDGVVDLALIRKSTRFLNQRTVWILFLNADGTLKGHTGIELTDLGYDPELEAPFKSVSGIGDVDDDGVVDIAVGVFDGDLTGAMWIILLNTDGSIKASRKIVGTELACVPCARGGGTNWPAPVGDLNADGVVDLAVPWGSNEGRDRLVVLFLDSAGAPVLSTDWGWLRSRDNPVATMGDIDGDDIADLAYAWEEFYSFLRISFLNNDGTEREFKEILSWPSDEKISSIGRGGDLDGDLISDVLVTTFSVDRGAKAWAVLLNSDGTLRGKLTVSHPGFGSMWGATFIGDLDGDGITDMGLLDMHACCPDLIWIVYPQQL